MKLVNAVTGPGMVNTYVAWDEESGKGFIVDPGGYAKEVTDYMRENGIIPEYIILTHGHGDHIGGIEGFKKDFPDIKVVANEYEKDMLSNPGLNMSTAILGKPVTVHADIFVKDGDELEIGDMKLKFSHTPGHSPGGQIILVDDVLFSGDTLFQQSVGRTDFEGCSFDALVKSIHEKIFILPDETKVLPGHMGDTSVGFEKKHNPFV